MHLERCINRNIVECKYQCGTDDVFQIIRINRNIVECKLPYVTVPSLTAAVLIETLWNVNLDPGLIYLRSGSSY